MTTFTKSIDEIDGVRRQQLSQGEKLAHRQVHPPKDANRRGGQVKTTVAPGQRNKTRRKTRRAYESRKERGSSQQRKGYGNFHGLAPMATIIRQITTQSFSTDQRNLFSTRGDNSGQKTPIVIEAEVEGHLIHRMYCDGGLALEVLYEHCFNRLHPKIKNQMVPTTTLLLGFSSEISWPLGQISLMVTLGDEEHSTKALMNFMVVRSPSPYNGIIDRRRSQEKSKRSHYRHGILKFLVNEGIARSVALPKFSGML
ncbi:hypothetical protein Tco_0023936 [Tanacetum coccineum]